MPTESTTQQPAVVGIGPIDLPYPPTINHYYGRTRTGQVFIKPAGRAYRAHVVLMLAGVDTVQSTDIALHAQIYPPDKRRRDLDNVLKALFDALQHAGAITDDAHIGCLLIERSEVVKGGKVIITILGRRPKFEF